MPETASPRRARAFGKTQIHEAGDASRPGLLARILQVRHALRPSEQRVASYVLGAPNRVTGMSIGELAEAVGVTDPTVARFCQALGYSGFKAFKVALLKSLATGVPYVHTDVSPTDTAADVVAKVFDRSIAGLIAMRNQVDPKLVERASERLARARRVEFYGVGNSGIVALDAQHKFFLLGMHTVAYTDPHWQVQSAVLLTAEDVVVAISRTGRTRDMIQTVELAQKAGATVIAITAHASRLARLADIALPVEVEEDPDVYAPMAGRLAQLALVDALAVAVALKRGPALEQMLRRAKATLADKRVRERGGEMLTPVTLAARGRWV
ncbi:MAG: SIS domain-containing protein [Casimicrobiaceae bacterium]|nr:SIS domain-containing protein [Casimicrobiaceae bacterium]MCX8099338.1 SIS domain-containing protein [Casimicrobiaceae bacterium]MDW8313079.1 SIS domain-containing protein [Burkholderiales bacterium]